MEKIRHRYRVRIDTQADAINFVKRRCSENEEDTVFVACGGDGTLNAIVNGAIGFNNALVTCYPCGSGNDFVKIYGGKEKLQKR